MQLSAFLYKGKKRSGTELELFHTKSMKAPVTNGQLMCVSTLQAAHWYGIYRDKSARFAEMSLGLLQTTFDTVSLPPLALFL